MTSEMVQVSDVELELLAKAHGPQSIEARVLETLRSERAKDRQVFAWRFGKYLLAGPRPDALTEAAMLDLADEDEEE